MWKHWILRFKYLVLKNMLTLNPVKQKFTSPSLPSHWVPPLRWERAGTHTSKTNPLLRPRWRDVSADGPVSITAQKQVPSLTPFSWAAQSFPLHFRENHQVSSDHPQKGVYRKKGSLSSASPGIQSHISNSGKTMLHIVCLDCRPLEEGLTLCHHKPVTTRCWYKSLCKTHRSSASPPALWKPGRQPESRAPGTAGLCISKYATHGLNKAGKQFIKLQSICFTQVSSLKFKN